MASIAEKKVILSLSDGASVNLNKPIDIPESVTDIMQITEPGWYHGKFFFHTEAVITPDGSDIDGSSILNTPAMKIQDKLTFDNVYYFDVFVTKTGNYIFSLAGHLFYGETYTSSSPNSINWEIVSPLVVDDLTSTSTDKALSANQGNVLNEKVESKMNAPIYSSTDLTPGVSNLADGQIYIVYYN